jgi:hypothetical protein
MTITATIDTWNQAEGTSIFIGYKATGNSPMQREMVVFTGNANNGQPITDWSGYYVAPELETAQGYLNDVVQDTNGSGTAYVNAVYVDFSQGNNGIIPNGIIRMEGEELSNGSITEDVKAELVRMALSVIGVNLPENEPLIQSLGNAGYLYQGPLSEGDTEIIVPLSLMEAGIISVVNYQAYTIRAYNQTNEVTNSIFSTSPNLNSIPPLSLDPDINSGYHDEL